MKRILLLLAIGSGLCFYSCNPSGGKKENRVAKGNRYYGGTIRLNEGTPVLDLYPYYIYDNVSYAIACQIYDGLVKINPKDLSVVPDIAKKWDIDETGTVYTFHLNTNVNFQDDPCFPNGKGKKVTANDFKYSMEQLCTATPDNVVFSITFKNAVEGANEYYES
ncbi:MAG TPA: ABC transporter substrate-binding protein, partial [Bacteroidia bacterium]|nr:ABC transporter substrate-binding protein [Bacteroidia bacterium]